MTEVAEKPKMAVSDMGNETEWPEKTVKTALALLVLNGGGVRRTAKVLAEEGMEIPWSTLRHWKERTFKKLYFETREELASEVGEEIAGLALERALQADEAQREYIEKAVEKINQVDPDHLAKNALALANAKASDIQMSQLLRDRPTEIKRVDVKASIAVLERLGVVERSPEEAIDAEVVEETP